jgi:hypothetical protein
MILKKQNNKNIKKSSVFGGTLKNEEIDLQIRFSE